MILICKNCNKEFEEPYKAQNSALVRFLTLGCPYCDSIDVELSEISKLRLERNAKINKINTNDQ